MSGRHDGAHYAGCGCGEEHRDVVAGDGVNEGWLHAYAPPSPFPLALAMLFKLII
jgi:hypothetical protein